MAKIGFIEGFVNRVMTKPKKKEKIKCPRCEKYYEGRADIMCPDCNKEIKLMGIEIVRANRVDNV
jgi:hypothetical protein